MTIQWKTPFPRSGIAGALDRLVGPGSMKAELALQFVTPVLSAIAAACYAAHVAADWSGLQYALCALLALDRSGGVVTNATSTAKRWHHRAGQTPRHHLGFVSLHLLHILISHLVKEEPYRPSS